MRLENVRGSSARAGFVDAEMEERSYENFEAGNVRGRTKLEAE